MRTTTLYSVGSKWTRDHEAIIRFYGEAPRWRAHSRYGIKAMAVFGSPPPRIVIGSLSAGAEAGCFWARAPVGQAATVRSATPAGISPIVTIRHRAMRSFRASATIMVVFRFPAPSVRA
jgi:hypothetical protein